MSIQDSYQRKTVDRNSDKRWSGLANQKVLTTIVWFMFLLPTSGFAAAVDNVQSGTLSSSGNGTVTANITAVDLSKSFLIFNTRSNSNRPPGSMVRGRIASSTTVEFERVTNESSTISIQWYVVEFQSGVTVQRGSVNQSSSTVNVPINPVSSLNQAYVTWSKTPSSGDGAWSDDDPIVGELTTTSNLQFRVNVDNSNHVIWWQVIEYTNAAEIFVQKGTTSWNSSTKDETITLGTTIDEDNSFLLVGFRTSGSYAIGKAMLRAEIKNSTQIKIEREKDGVAISEIVWQVIELKDGSTVQHEKSEFSSGDATETESITSVDLNKSVAFA
ncbi:MAG TPA: hypothetical protein ENH49_05105, partial [Candidatus Marinimicrobia bacterium]|nr:hypothetical protein [Candidatus Neomarinimicrobiota bacterium]